MQKSFIQQPLPVFKKNYNGMYSIMWVFKRRKDFTVLKSLSTENYSDFDDYFILNKVEGDKIYLNTRIEK